MSLEKQSEKLSLGNGPASSSSFVTITVNHRRRHWNFDFAETATMTDLFEEISSSLDIPLSNQKLLVPKGLLPEAPNGLLLKSSSDTFPSLRDLQGKTLTLLGSGAAEVQAVNSMAEKIASRNATRRAQAGKPRTSRETQAIAALDAKYTFLVVRPLDGLPNPERSTAILMRLKNDPGIRAAMRKHRFSVSLLTEMEPLAHTSASHEGTSRTLGLNRNKGEVIELRLRTDAHDGYRDYKTIRKTLCHELAHNVHGPHDASFWALCHQIEGEVDRADWKTSGQTIGESSRYAIQGRDEEAVEDEGGWTGGEFRLGGATVSMRDSSRRQILAAAALARQLNEVRAEGRAVDDADKDERERRRRDKAE
ncbi:hypothetical protein L249_3114 [Ophiocordyceps polyrhachis-furcata BCC 54312]|uniref:WLM domain-containing protein n=1 Tax=Ophiocordyceps polyrhachis-furcata BCC 54312 TaxID=1330021 RepID=A0A367LRJ7_9HYPO|nr:hypothetical protein L249_3114 [Ophiocordyceps polyrhachis-furcata BCC 54312]